MKSTSSERGKKFRSRNPWYRLWEGAKRRCEDPSHKTFKFCGARGIKFQLSQHECELIFIRDGGHWMEVPSLDRIDPDKHYHWSNCRVIEKRLNESLKRPSNTVYEWSD